VIRLVEWAVRIIPKEFSKDSLKSRRYCADIEGETTAAGFALVLGAAAIVLARRRRPAV
jgi:MYXO-CTERM domain-containing protein